VLVEGLAALYGAVQKLLLQQQAKPSVNPDPTPTADV
jgi:hypothetical protein